MIRLMVRAGLLAACCLAVLSTGANGATATRALTAPKLGTIGKPVTTVLCPARMDVAYQNVSNQNADLSPWQGFDYVSQTLYLDTSENGVTVMDDAIRCRYKYSASPSPYKDEGPYTLLHQSLNGRRCTVRSDKKGFDCTAP